MNLRHFGDRFERAFPGPYREQATRRYERGWYRRWIDRCPSVPGMTAVKNQRLLQLAYACLPGEEGYLEVGTFRGKTLISALRGNQPRPTYACDNFSEFDQHDGERQLRANLLAYGLGDRVMFLNEDFHDALRPGRIRHRIGLYLYDGAHDFVSQYDGIRLAEPSLADEALVIVDDWRQGPDSGSFAEAGTRQAIAQSGHHWTIIHELPARYNGDQAMWWNGVGVLAFRRKGT